MSVSKIKNNYPLHPLLVERPIWHVTFEDCSDSFWIDAPYENEVAFRLNFVLPAQTWRWDESSQRWWIHGDEFTKAELIFDLYFDSDAIITNFDSSALPEPFAAYWANLERRCESLSERLERFAQWLNSPDFGVVPPTYAEDGKPGHKQGFLAQDTQELCMDNTPGPKSNDLASDRPIAENAVLDRDNDRPVLKLR